MDFRTKIMLETTTDDWKIGYNDAVLLMGSCFSDAVGERMQRVALSALLNPFGTLYNPLSIAAALNRLMSGKRFSTSELFEYEGLWHSAMHHSRFSATTAEKTLEQINASFCEATMQLQKARFLILTLGAAWVYESAERGAVVANCHKLPEARFVRRLLSVDEIVSKLNNTISALQIFNPDLRIVFTVSPIRHLRDGAHGNQLSKSTLLLAVNALCEQHAHARYFPAYEIVLDELRDYRFYADDMAHPSSVAVQYVWERFAEQFFDERTKSYFPKIERLKKSLAHRPFNTETAAYADFVKRTQQQIVDIERELGVKLF